MTSERDMRARARNPRGLPWQFGPCHTLAVTFSALQEYWKEPICPPPVFWWHDSAEERRVGAYTHS